MSNEKKSLFGKSENFEKEVYEALHASGFHLIKSDDEVKDFVENFGETKIELPQALADSDKLFDSLTQKMQQVDKRENYAMAARGQNSRELPPEIILKMKDDILHGKKVKGHRGKNGDRKEGKD